MSFMLNNTNIQELLNQLIPVGTIIAWNHDYKTTPPDGWALCNGETVTNKFGEKISVPDLRGRSLIMEPGDKNCTNEPNCSTLKFGNYDGKARYTLSKDEMPNHQHHYPGQTTVNGGNFQYAMVSTSGGITTGGPTYGTGGSKPFNNLPPVYAINYIIKIEPVLF